MNHAFAEHENELNEDIRLFNNFKNISEQVAELLVAGGINVKPYRPGLPFFKKLSIAQKVEAIRNLEFYLILCAEHTAEGYQLKDAPSFTWRALNKLGLTPTSDLFTRIKESDIIEIYSKDNVQLFRNFKFFEFCSYTLEELYCIEWFHLYERDASVGPLILQDILKVQQGLFPDGLAPSVGHHFLREAMSEQNLTMDYFLRWAAPLYASKEVAGFIVLEEATLYEN